MKVSLRGSARATLLCAALLATGSFLLGCSTVKPYQKEHFADHLMTDPQEAMAIAHELKWLEAREGSTGGSGGAGGGCACK